MIDFKKYSNPEILDNIADIMSAPQRAPIRIIKWGLAFVVLGFAIDFFLANCSNQQTFVTILTAVISFFMIVIAGVLLGTYLFFRDLNGSIQSLLDYANKLIHSVIGDVASAFDSVKTSVNGYQIVLPKGHEIVSGIFVDVINPAAKRCLENKIPVIGGFVFRTYSILINALLKISAVFFSRADKEIDKIVNTQVDKIKDLANTPLNIVENTIDNVWMPKIADYSNTYIGKAKSYIHKTIFLIATPLLLFMLALIGATGFLVHFVAA